MVSEGDGGRKKVEQMIIKQPARPWLNMMPFRSSFSDSTGVSDNASKDRHGTTLAAAHLLFAS